MYITTVADVHQDTVSLYILESPKNDNTVPLEIWRFFLDLKEAKFEICMC